MNGLIENAKGIPGFPGYFCTPDGDVYSARTVSSKPQITQHLHKLQAIRARSGHFRVGVVDQAGKPSNQMVHRLVLLTFVGPCPAGMECCHADGNPSNNQLCNLRWDTRKNNVADARRHGTISAGEKNGQSKLTLEKVNVVRQMLAEGKPQAAIAKAIGVSQPTVSAVNTGVRWR